MADSTNAKKQVVIGAGTAAINAIRTMRQLGSNDDITLIAKETPYSRMVLPYYLEQNISEPHTATASLNQLEKWQVQSHFGRSATAIDTDKKSIALDNGDEIPYDNVLIATGSSAVLPPIAGVDHPRVCPFWTLEHAKTTHHHLNKQSHVVLVGAGFISFTILNGIIQRAGKVTIVELAPRILPRMVDETAAAHVTAWLEKNGVNVICGVAAEKITDANGQARIHLKGGQTLDADLVVMATGIRTNLDWVKNSSITIEQGIVVDAMQRSNVPGVYAAGDVAQGENLITGAKEVHAIEPTAAEHGRVAAANMIGQSVSYPGSMLINIVGVSGLDAASFGSWNDDTSDVISAWDGQQYCYRKYLFREGRMVGAIYLSPSRKTWAGNELGMLKGLVHAQADLSAWKEYLAKSPFDLKTPYLAAGTASNLLPKTILGQAAMSPN